MICEIHKMAEQIQYYFPPKKHYHPILQDHDLLSKTTKSLLTGHGRHNEGALSFVDQQLWSDMI
jgi:hypothetical protein